MTAVGMEGQKPIHTDEILHKTFHQEVQLQAGEMAQWLKAQTALPEVLSSIPSNHMVTHNHP
jgi:plasmid maintenance system antidote protein VapI